MIYTSLLVYILCTKVVSAYGLRSPWNDELTIIYSRPGWVITINDDERWWV